MHMTFIYSKSVSDGQLELQLEIAAHVISDRVPMRIAHLNFRNLTPNPLRLFLPESEPFRANISTIFLLPEGAPPIFVPEPRPHGYIITEKDFHLVDPSAALSFQQSFTIDPFARDGGLGTARLPGFETGKTVRVNWVYENRISKWPKNQPVFDGPTREIFGGDEIPFIWVGKLTTNLSWTVPE
jgi:hypothetical protein